MGDSNAIVFLMIFSIWLLRGAGIEPTQGNRESNIRAFTTTIRGIDPFTHLGLIRVFKKVFN